MKIAFDLDDGSVLRTRWDLLLMLKEHFPNLKVTLFWIPYDFEKEKEHYLRVQREDFLKRVKENLSWVQLVPHGITHVRGTYGEFEKATYEDTMLAIKAIEEGMKQEGLPYEKGFKAPFWQWNDEVVRALDDSGWWGAIDRNQPDMPGTKKFYVYSDSIDEPFWKTEKEVLKLHGHMTPPSSNNLEDNLINLLKMPTDAEFHYVTDFLEEKK